ncbi:MAG: tRNA preQ1(34) S-adenosylmethionine ribosyltransferase-isomerase QueA [Candidatus Rokubacteria bacterium]|nr:tRNA preQ1(34) S-adenosylmethionine ribosyltransferase-isomerase QueA [Candidatus Rokubacteria bacterium]
MDLALFDYELPPDRIAQYPAERRDASRLLVLDRATGRWEDRVFAELPALLRAGDCLVVNDSRVIPARLPGTLPGGAQVELLFLRELAPGRWEVLARPAKRCRPGAVIVLADVEARVVEAGAEGRRVVEVSGVGSARDFLERHGLPPLPPYIRRHRKPGAEDWERYQTVYARHDGSLAAPTAGLHFTPALMDQLRAGGVEVHALTLHAGPASFRPIRAAEVEKHPMPAEQVAVTEAVARAVNRARGDGRRVVAVGTTVVRALEWASDPNRRVSPVSGFADLFIYPGHAFKVVDALITNFHLPRYTHLLLVSAFAGRELVLAAYRHAEAAGYRFYSYGDAMLVL